MCFQLRAFIIPMKVEAQVHIVPHLKALIYVELGLPKTKPWWYFFCVSELSEKGNLLHKIGFFKTGVVGTVQVHLLKFLSYQITFEC